ncbi:MAG: ABC transporter permease [Helicobacter sp.]|nr:ABC transporter permease [Helicobacter sp.]
MLKSKASVESYKEANAIKVLLSGVWDRVLSKKVLKGLEKLYKSNTPLIIALDSSFDLDFCGGEILLNWLQKLESKHLIKESALLSHAKTQEIFNILKEQKPLKNTALTQDIIKAHIDTFIIIKNISARLVAGLNFLGEIFYYFINNILNPQNFRLKALFFQIQEAIIKATPIVSLACFLIGIVIAYQGSLQLRQFGASVLIVEMSAMLTLREMSPIIVAIIVAGRSASAFSAEIGMMNSSQEIDAMKTMGFNPISFLVIPRLLALCLALPLVVFIADIFGLIGSMLVAQMQLGIGSEQFVERFLEMVEMRHFWVGILKAPFFGLIIGLIGCYHGFSAKKDTRSIGVHTTKSVVESIFCVIAFDALCSIIFTQLGI